MLVTGCAVAAIVILAASSGSVDPLDERPPRPPLPTRTPLDRGTPPPRETAAALPEWFNLVITVGLVMIAVLFGLLLVWALYAGLRRRRDTAKVAEVERVRAERLAAAVETGLTRVESGTPDDAVIACWVALEQAAAAVELDRRPAETPAEFTTRVFSTVDVSHDDLDTLAALYREARYSTHPSSEASRVAAREALQRLQQALRAVSAGRFAGWSRA
ncbi:hypothetical protein GCM10009534_55890 [Kribbella sandramycini]